MKTKIERAVDQVLDEQEADAVDFGGDQQPQLDGTSSPVDVAVRHCSVGDGEQTRFAENYKVEGPEEWKAGFSPPLSTEEIDEFERLVQEQGPDIDCDAVLEILLPHVSHREVYDSDYERWEAWVWGEFPERDDYAEVEEQVDFSQVDFGEPAPAVGLPVVEPDEVEPDDVPYPQGESTQWFAIFHMFDRTDNWVRRISGSLDTEDPLAALAIFYEAASSPTGTDPEAASDAHEVWRDTGEEPFAHYMITHAVISSDATKAAVADEEWNAGIGRTQEVAEEMFMRSEPAGDAEWEEL